MMGYKEDGNWSVEAKFTSMNRPWRHPPKDDESGAGAAGTHVRNTMKNLQIYMMQGGGDHHPPPPPRRPHHGDSEPTVKYTY